jgi:hypothetical protein
VNIKILIFLLFLVIKKYPNKTISTNPRNNDPSIPPIWTLGKGNELITKGVYEFGRKKYSKWGERDNIELDGSVNKLLCKKALTCPALKKRKINNTQRIVAIVLNIFLITRER